MLKISSFYKFVKLTDLEGLQAKILQHSRDLELEGTVLLAEEGINATMAGKPEAISDLESFLTELEPFNDLEFKHSKHEGQVFRRLLVKIKPEIITMKVPRANPLEMETGEYLDPKTFKTWQDEGEEVLIVDTRNDYEVAAGTFEGAIDPKIKRFSDFPEWVEQNLADHKDKKIVTFCTGGIRCEKATAFMKDSGFKKVYQLKGGILKYLEETHGDAENNHFNGSCVVFDKRLAIDKQLEKAEEEICYGCLKIIPAGDKSEHTHHNRRICTDCHEEMIAAHQKRLEKGLLRHQENLARRAQYRHEHQLSR